MPIRYSLRENHLTPDPNDYMASVSPTRTVEIKDVIERMIQRGSTITKADILSVMEDFQKVLESFIYEGASINLPFANYNTTSIKGVFEGKTDIFDSNRHHISINLLPGRDLKQFLKNGIPVEKQETVIPQPNVSEFTDFSTGQRNTTITPGGMAQILGHRLKVNPEVEEEGIYFIKDDNTEFKVTIIGQNKPSTLMFMIPFEITTGEYTLEVRTKTGNTVRVGRLGATLTAA
ncbi:MAG: DNA-binding domain-containing protein [Ignavibacteria bacterium]|jgi:hypothetical protein